MPRDRNPRGRYTCIVGLHIPGGDCPHCVPYVPPESVPLPVFDPSDIDDGDRALELLRELVGLYVASLQPGSWAVNEYRHGSRSTEWDSDMGEAFARARALVED